jgi:hypothetical protein
MAEEGSMTSANVETFKARVIRLKLEEFRRKRAIRQAKLDNHSKKREPSPPSHPFLESAPNETT